MIDDFKAILKANKITGKEMSGLLKMTYDSYRTMTKRRVRVVPRWVRGFLLGYKLGKMAEKDLGDE